MVNAGGCGAGFTDEGLFGYTLDRTALTRYTAFSGSGDRLSATGAVPGDYRNPEPLGVLAAPGETGTAALISCLRGSDRFLSLEPGCEGATVIGSAGSIWTTEPALPAKQLYRCKTGAGELYESTDANCGDDTLDKPLGFVLQRPW